jgi:sigma-B regulation protein RsbU (phosphoserine phosphatase)
MIGQEVVVLPPTGSIVNAELPTDFKTRELHLQPGDALVIATDGLTESRDARGQQLGASGVSIWLSELSGSAQTMADAIVRRLRRRSSRIADDLAILVIRFVPGPRRAALVAPAEQAVGAAAPP